MMSMATAKLHGVNVRGRWTRVRRAFRHDRWMATTWSILLVSAVYASARGTLWLYPTAPQRVSVAEAINANPAIVALYGPIMDTRSLGELAMLKMTVLYSVVVACVCAEMVHRHARTDARTAHPRTTGLRPGVAEAACFAALVGALAAMAALIAGLPTTGCLAFGASWVGVGLAATSLSAFVHRLTANRHAARWVVAAVISVLFGIRALGDGLHAPALSWLSPFGWSTQLQAWSSPRWWVLSLYGIASLALWVAARSVKPGREHGRTFRPGNESAVAGDRSVLIGWTFVTAILSTWLGAVSTGISAVLSSSNADAMLRQFGNDSGSKDVVTALEFSIVAAVTTAFGIGVFNRAGDDNESHERTFVRTVAMAIGGPTWLLLVAGAMFTAGQHVTGVPWATEYTEAALNQAPAVWTIVAMTAVAWSLRPAWAGMGWALLIAFTVIGPFGALVGLPSWLVGFSPFARIALMPANSFDGASTIALIVGSCVLLALAAFDHSRRDGRGLRA